MEGRGRRGICDHAAGFRHRTAKAYFSDKIEHVPIPIVAGIWPLVSYRNAEFLHNEVPGVNVTPEILERMRIASDKGKEDAREEGIAIARESLLEVRDVIPGRAGFRAVREC